MKTRQLILALQLEDPSGELDVAVGNLPIHFIANEPAFYDGKLQRLIQDDTNHFYNIVGAEITNKGSKIQIHTLSIEDALLDNPDIPVRIDVADCAKEEYRLMVEGWRQEAREIQRKADELCRQL
jgi:hypothetical protein